MILPGKNKLDYLLVLLMILMSANPFVSRNENLFLGITLFLLAIRISDNVMVGFNIRWKHLLIILFVLGYELLHAVIFKNFKPLNVIRLTATMYAAYLILKTSNVRFVSIYTKLVFYLSLLSLILYPLMYTNFGPALLRFSESIIKTPESEMGYYAPTLVFYTFHASFFRGFNEVYRNAGFAWEAGAFAIFVNIALMLNLFLTVKEKLASKKNIVYILSVVSTFSTTGYVALFLILFTYFLTSPKQKAFRWVMLLLFLVLSIYVYRSTSFLQDKINTQYQVAGESQNRFGSAILDINDLMKRPLFGWSRDKNQLFGEGFTTLVHRPNGVTNLLRGYGIVYFLVFFSLIYISFKDLGKISSMKKASSFGFYFLFLLLVCGFSQLIFDKMFFRSMVFWGDFIAMAFLAGRMPPNPGPVKKSPGMPLTTRL